MRLMLGIRRAPRRSGGGGGGAVVVTGRRRWSCLQRRRPEAVAVRTTTRINRSIEDESGQERWGKALIVPAHVFF
jgi:hypothetical protein